MTKIKCVHLSLLVLIASAGASLAQLANSPPAPHWIAGTQSGASVEKKFEWSGKLLKAILFSAADGKAEITINGRSAGSVEGREKAASLDVTQFVREGSNTVALRSDGAVAALLELNGDLARKQWISSDESWATKAGAITVRGPVDADAANNPFDLKNTFDAYNSWQLAKPGNQNQATDPAMLILPPGFKAELIRSSQPGEDSWVSMAFDPEGRITLGMEKKGLLRLTFRSTSDTPARNQDAARTEVSALPAPLQYQSVELIDDTLLECRGLLYAHGALFANANDSKGLYRLCDADGDGVFEDKKELLHTEGGVGHGRNHIKLGPDGKIYTAHGNNVLLPKNLSPKSPLKNYANDQLIPNPWDGTMFDGDVQLPAGHILRMNPDGSEVELLAGGLRNPLDIAFNRDDELFTFDADMERDVGTPWYMPTRVLHVVPGADFGWRRGTGRFPSWYIDTLPSVIDIGLSSPTATFFGYGARFPQKYQDAYYIMDWSYGRIIAVHLKLKGASYTGEQETFVSGRPLNVTDGCIGPDGAMWFITGGRGTQSGLYRVSHASTATSDASVAELEDVKSPFMHRLELEELAAQPPAGRQPSIWWKAFSLVGNADPFISHAARRVMEQVPAEVWRKEALEETTGLEAMVRCLALARMGDTASRHGILSRLSSISFNSLKPDEQLALLRVLAVTFVRLGGPSEEERVKCLNWFESKYPQAQPTPHLGPLPKKREPDARARKLLADKGEPESGAEKLLPLPAGEGWGEGEALQNRHLNWEICRMLVYLKSPMVIEKTIPLLKAATASEDLLFYPFMLRYVKDGWTLESRRVCFEALNRAEKLNGASTYFKAISDTRSELAAALSPADAQTLASVIFLPKPAQLLPAALPGHTFKNWTLADLAPKLDQVSRGRSFEKAKAALVGAQCVFCHKVGNDPSLPAGIFGPDLTQVSARFNRHDLLMHILEPSNFIDEKFKLVTVTKIDGTSVTGSLESEDDERVELRTNPISPDKTEIGKSMIKQRKISDVSPMAPGLLNALKAEQIFDILAWFEAGGDPKHKVFQP